MFQSFMALRAGPRRIRQPGRKFTLRELPASVSSGRYDFPCGVEMNSERVTLPGKALAEASDVVDSVQAPVHAADLNSLERARMLVASKFSEDERAHESINRGTEAAELLGKLRMDAETLAVALLLPLVDKGALDPTAIKKWVGVEAARLTQGALRIASLKDLRKTATETLQANRLRQMLLTIAEDPRVVLVSLAHQLCALRAAKTALEQIRNLFDLGVEKGGVDGAGKKCVHPLRRAAGVQEGDAVAPRHQSEMIQADIGRQRKRPRRRADAYFLALQVFRAPDPWTDIQKII